MNQHANTTERRGHLGLKRRKSSERSAVFTAAWWLGSRPEIAQFACLVTHQLDSSLGQTFDGSVAIRTKTGKTHLLNADLAHASLPKLREKFLAITGPLLGDCRAKASAEEILCGKEPLWRPASRLLAELQPNAL